jgi:DNA methylase
VAGRRGRHPDEPLGVALTQAELYREIDHALSWSERELPERERTKHVHRLHPYLGKFVPQLVEALLERYVRPGGRVLDPFAGSGTTLVQALESGYDAVGIDIAAFNALLVSVKTREHDLEALERDVREVGEALAASDERPSPFLRAWFAPRAAGELLHFRAAIAGRASEDALKVVLARAARSARLTTHFDLDYPRAPQSEPYWCHKHRRTCRPVAEARKFLRRYLADTTARIRTFADVRHPRRAALVLHGDARDLELGGPYDGVITSPPYPGLIDYHEQHRYAYELLGLDDRRERELGAAARGTSRAALDDYVTGVADVLARAKSTVRRGAPVCVVVNDRRELYPEILERAGLRLDERLERHVNRRTGRRAGEYYESILVCR